MTRATKRLRRSSAAGVAGLAALATVGGVVVATAGSAGATSTATVTRIAGNDRYDTAAQLAAKAFPTGSANVILASGAAAHFADALAGNYLAGQLNAPILLTSSTDATVAAKALAEITALKPTTVYILGDIHAVPAAQEAQLTAAGYTVKRLGGTDRYATAKLVAEQSGLTAAGSIGGVKTAIVVNGQNFPDALSAGALAFADKLPVIPTTPGALSPTASATLTDLGIKQVLIAGSTTAVSAADETAINALGITTLQRFAGTDRANTSQLLANWEITNAGFSTTNFTVASGDQTLGGADALAGGPFAGSTNSPILVTDTITNAGNVTAFAAAHASSVTSVNVLGKAASVADSVVAAITSAVQGGTANQSLTVTPAAKVTNTVSTTTAGQTNQGSRTYTVAGLDSTKTYAIELVPAANVVVSSTGNVTFTSAATVAANGGTSIETVNGAPGTLAAAGAGTTKVTGVAPVSGSITFTVDSVVPGAVVPVVFSDTNGDGTLNFGTAPTVAAPQQPSEPFGIGGEVDWNPAEAPAGAITNAPETIASVDKTNKVIVTSGAGAATYKYDSNDLFYNGSVAAGNQLTMAGFEAILTAGDQLAAGTVYTTNSAFQSTFVLNNISPAAPVISSVTAADTNAVVTVASANLVSGSTVNVYVAPGAGAAFSAATKVASSSTDADSTTAGFQIKVNGLSPATAYTFFATQTVGTEESANSAGSNVTTTAATDPALSISSVTINDVNDGVGNATAVIVTFNKAVTAAQAAGFNVSPSSQPGLLDGASAVALDATNTVATYTLNNALNDASTDVSYKVTLTAGSVSDSAGVNGTLTGTFSY